MIYLMKYTNEDPKLTDLWRKPADLLSLLNIPVSKAGEDLENVKHWTAGKAVGRGEPLLSCVVYHIVCKPHLSDAYAEMETWEVDFKKMPMSARRLCEMNWKLMQLTIGCKFLSDATCATFV